MKRIVNIVLLLLVNQQILSQEQRNTNQFFFLPVVKVSEFAGKEYRYSIDVKSVPSDTNSGTSSYALQVGNGDYDFLNYDYLKKRIKDTNWQQLTIEGKVTIEAEKIWFYQSIYGNGSFYFDNLKFEVHLEKDNWTGIPIEYGDFEKSRSNNPLKGFKKTSATPKGFVFDIVDGNGTTPSRVLKVTAVGGKPYTVTNYGNNWPKGKYYNVNGIKLYCETYGTGEPLLLLHGNGQSISSFRKQIPELAKKYRVIAVDTRGQGDSFDTISAKFSYEMFAEDMKVLMDTIGIRNANVLGWSDGGNTGLILAIKYPQYVNRLITMGANLNPDDTSVDAGILRQTEKDLKKLSAKTDKKSKRLTRLLSMLLEEPHIDVKDLQRIKSKTLVMAGEKDVIKENHTRLIASNIPGAKLLILDNADHMAPEKKPDQFNKAVLDFLEER